LLSARYEMIANGRTTEGPLLAHEEIPSGREVLGSTISMQTTSVEYSYSAIWLSIS